MNWATLTIFFAHGAVASAICLREHPLSRTRAFYVVGMISGSLLMGWTAVTAFGFGAGMAASGGMAGGFAGVLIASMVILIGSVFHAPFLGRVVGELIFALGRWGMSEDNVVVARTFDQAEAAELRRDHATAERLYREAIEADPEDAEARVRLAELLGRGGRVDLAAALMGEAYALAETPERKAPLAFRWAELCGVAAGPSAEREILERIVEELGDTRYARLAERRLGRAAAEDAPDQSARDAHQVCQRRAAAARSAGGASGR